MIKILLLAFNLFPFADSQIEDVDLIHQQVYEIMDDYPDSALVLCDKAIEIGDRIGYEWGVANSYYIKAYIQEDILNKGVTGLLLYLKAAHILENADDEKSVKTYTSLMLNAGSILRVHGKYELAIEHYQKALKKCESHELDDQELKLNYNLAYAYMDNRELINAKDVMYKTATLAMISGNKKLFHDGYNMLGIISMEMGDIEKARNYFNFIIKLSDASSKIQADALNNLGDIAYKHQQYSEAIKYYFDAKEVSQDVKHSRLKFSTNLGLTKAYNMAGEFEDGIISGLRAIEYIGDIVPEHDHLEIYYIMAQMYSGLGNLEKEKEYTNTYYQASQKFFDDQKEIIKVKEEFQIDLLLAGFYSEIQAEELNEKYQKAIGLGITLLFLISMIWLKIKKVRSDRTAATIRKIIAID